MARFRSRLKQLMLNKAAAIGEPITQRALAAQSGVSLATISRWYDGNFDRLDADTLGRLMNYFGCTRIEELIELVEGKSELEE